MVKTYDLSRFTEAHRRSFETALGEIRNGRKNTHWMWYILPQLQGLGRSATSRFYALSGVDEAKAFLDDPYLGGNLKEICSALLLLDTDDPVRVFGRPDGMKLRSCMTLFSRAAGSPSVFDEVLDKYFGGEQDNLTLKMLEGKDSRPPAVSACCARH